MLPRTDPRRLLVVLREGREVERLKYGGKTGAEEGEKIVTAMRELALAPFGSNEVKELSELSDLRVGRGLQGAIVVSKPIGEAMVVAILQPQPAPWLYCVRRILVSDIADSRSGFVSA